LSNQGARGGESDVEQRQHRMPAGGADDVAPIENAGGGVRDVVPSGEAEDEPARGEQQFLLGLVLPRAIQGAHGRLSHAGATVSRQALPTTNQRHDGRGRAGETDEREEDVTEERAVTRDDDLIAGLDLPGGPF